MSIVFARDPLVSVAKRFGNNCHRHTRPSQACAVSATKIVEGDAFHPRLIRSFFDIPGLLAWTPTSSSRMLEQQSIRSLADSRCTQQGGSFVLKVDDLCPPALRVD